MFSLSAEVLILSKLLSTDIESGSLSSTVAARGWSAKSYGKYSCRIALPENVEFEKIRAEVKDGVLYITIPKSTSDGKILDINVQ